MKSSQLISILGLVFNSKEVVLTNPPVLCIGEIFKCSAYIGGERFKIYFEVKSEFVIIKVLMNYHVKTFHLSCGESIVITKIEVSRLDLELENMVKFDRRGENEESFFYES